jgi:hypothetical protein
MEPSGRNRWQQTARGGLEKSSDKPKRLPSVASSSDHLCKVRRGRRLEGSTIANAAQEREYECEYGVVSATCDSVQLLAFSNTPRCRHFQLYAACCIGFRRTFNPKVAGSIPARAHN